MQNKRVHALAKELNVTSKELIERISSLNIEVKNHMSTLNAEEEKRVVNSYRNKSTPNKDDKKKNFKNNKNPNKKEGITIENKDMKESKPNK